MKKDYFKDESKAIIAQTHQLSKANSKVSDINQVLEELSIEQDESNILLDDMLSFADELIGKENEPYKSEKFLNYNFEYNSSNLFDSMMLELDSIDMTKTENFLGYFEKVEDYAERNNINLELEYEKMFAFESIELKHIQKGIGDNLICIDGFLSQDKPENIQEWLDNMPSRFKTSNIYYCKWESKKLFDIISSFFTIPIDELFKEGISGAIPISAIRVWKVAAKNSIQAGKSLSSLIYNNDKDYIMLGHSLGASVIQSCLNNLPSTCKCNILEAHLLGGAVDNNNHLWNNPCSLIQRKIYNYMSDNDVILKYLYKVGELDILGLKNPIGRNKIYLPIVDNIDLSYIIDGHTKYRYKLSHIIHD